MLPFTCGVLATLIVGILYHLHLERVNRRLIETIRQAERRKAYAQGYHDRAILALRRAGRLMDDGG